MSGAGPGPGAPARRSRAGLIAKILVFVVIVVLGNLLTHWLTDALDFQIRPSNEHIVHRIILATSAAYVLLLAIPFVPGVEIGLALMMILGPDIAFLVYVCTLAALVLSFTVGRLIPERRFIVFLRECGLERLCDLLSHVQGLAPEQRLHFLIERAPRRIVPWLLRYRYVALAVAINLPGSFLLGGGGGIALMAGLSRLFSPLHFVLTVAIAVAPVPLAWMYFGEHVAVWLY